MIEKKKEGYDLVVERLPENAEGRLTEEVQEEVLDFVKNDLQIGQKLSGIVKNIKPYGAF